MVMHTIPHSEQLLSPILTNSDLRVVSGGAVTRPSVLAAVRSARSVSLHGRTSYRLDVLNDTAALDARLRRANDSAPSAMVVELHPEGPGPVGPLVRTLTRHFPGVPLIVACTERAPDGREVLGAAHAGAELFVFPPDDDLAALVARLVGDSGVGDGAALHALPRLARRMLGLLTAHEPPPPRTVITLAERLSMKPRTLYRRMQANAWPSPGHLLIWGRLLQGAQAADEARTAGDSLTCAELATAAGFRSTHRAADSYRRYADVTLSEVRVEGVRALEGALTRTFPPRR
jgi:AraC-like DNA-binding protein